MPTPNINYTPVERAQERIENTGPVKPAPAKCRPESAQETNDITDTESQRDASPQLSPDRPHVDSVVSENITVAFAKAKPLENLPVVRDFFTRRHRAKTSSYLKPHSTFIGSQQSGLSTYEVKVELKEVDLENSYICGFLTIHGLTELHPEITTFFKGEIVGPRYSFITEKESWGSNSRNDLQHWGRFPSFRKLDFNTENDAANEDIYKNYLQNEYLYMRWKEVFLVPDASVKDIRGASFAGFYYICFNQLTGSVSGLYFHKCSVKFQQLELCHVPDGGCTANYEYQ